MKEITQFDNFELEIWRRPRQRNLHLRVRPDGGLRVTCHRRLSKREIFAFLNESRDFIAKRLLELEAQKKRFPPKEYLSGETFLWKGVRRPLVMVWRFLERIEVRENAMAIEMMAPLKSSKEARAGAFKRFSQREGRLILSERLEYWARVMGFGPKKLSIRGQSTRWGSCSGNGEISLNWKLISASPEVLDYVVVHELAHLKHMNHSPAFWELVAEFQPDFKAAKKWLRSFEAEINQQYQ